MNNHDAQWCAWHLHVATLGSPATDEVVRRVVVPTIDAVRARGSATPWFFIRYWQFGPHVRLRLAGLTSDQKAHLDGVLRDRMSEVLSDAGPGRVVTAEEYRRHATPLAAAGEGGATLDAGELWPAGVYQRNYEPEAERYGGSHLLPRSEALFHQSSELSLAFLRLHPPEAARSGLGLRATQAALGNLVDDEQRRRFCRWAVAGWQSWSARSGGGKIPAPLPLLRLEGPIPAPIRRWADQLGQEMTLWRDARGTREAERILHAHIHMLHNRLGLSVGQEQNHYLALADHLGVGVTAGAGAS